MKSPLTQYETSGKIESGQLCRRGIGRPFGKLKVCQQADRPRFINRGRGGLPLDPNARPVAHTVELFRTVHRTTSPAISATRYCGSQIGDPPDEQAKKTDFPCFKVGLFGNLIFVRADFDFETRDRENA